MARGQQETMREVLVLLGEDECFHLFFNTRYKLACKNMNITSL